MHRIKDGTVRRRRLSPALAGLGLMICLGFAIQACAIGDAEQLPGKPWHHIEGGFRSPLGSPARTASIFGDYVPFLTRRIIFGTNDGVTIPDGHVIDQTAALAGMKAKNPGDTITWLGHASFLLRLDGKIFLTDPFLTNRASPFDWYGPERLIPPAISIENLPPIDGIIVSHNHYDHLDAETVETLPGKDRITVFAPLGLGDFFRERGYTQVHDVDWYQTENLGDVKVTGVPAAHFSRRGLFDFNKVLWGGYVLEAGGYRLYFAGDTGYSPVFKEIGEKFAPIHTALIPIGAYEPRSIMRPSHVTPEQAVQLAQDIGADTLVGMHWGTIILTDEPQFEAPVRFRAAAQGAGIADERVWILKIGETRAINRPATAGEVSLSQLE